MKLKHCKNSIFVKCYVLSNFHIHFMQPIYQELVKIMQVHQLIGMSVIAVKHDEIAYSGMFGLSNIATTKSVSENTLYRLASVSKMVTATAFMMLVENGKISLQDDIGEVLGYKLKNSNFPKVSITPEMLLSHTSGLCDNGNYERFLMDSYHLDFPPLLENLFIDTGVYYSADVWGKEKPGTFFRYSNLNYGIIAALIEKTSGVRFDIFCRKHIFEPLQMNASFNVNDIHDFDDIAAIYGRTENGIEALIDDYSYIKPFAKVYSSYVPGSNGLMFAPQGGMRSSLSDLAKFMIMHINNGNYQGIQILKKETAELMTKPFWTYNGSNGDNYGKLFLSWGLGFQLLTDTAEHDKFFSDLKMCGHIGDGYGLLSCMYFSKEKKCGIIFCTNGSTSDYQKGITTAFYKVVEDAVAEIDREIFSEK
jgi:CubicO group peptidase (beta-lactamase class C family)